MGTTEHTWHHAWERQSVKESHHEKRDTGDIFFNTEILMPPDWYIIILKNTQPSFKFFALRKKGSKTKKRMKEEEIEKGDCGLPTRRVFFFFFEILSNLNQAVPNHLADESQTRLRAVEPRGGRRPASTVQCLSFLAEKKPLRRRPRRCLWEYAKHNSTLVLSFYGE